MARPDYSARGINPARLAAVRRFAGRSILDVGCGAGAYVLALADQYSVRGVDHQAFDAWADRPELFATGDAQDLRFDDRSVDTVISFETLEHLPDPKRALREYRRVAGKNLIVTVPNCDLSVGMRASGIIFNHWIDRSHVNFWQLASLCALLEEAGFVVTHRELINEINLSQVFAEALGLSGAAARVGARAFRALQRRAYPMTCLVVADRN